MTPATVTINGGASSLSGAFTWPENVDPSYDTLAYRLVNVDENGNDGSLVLGANAWKVLAASDITESSGTFSFNIPDTISVGGGSPVTVASPGRYRLDMQVATNNGAAAAGEMPGESERCHGVACRMICWAMLQWLYSVNPALVPPTHVQSTLAVLTPRQRPTRVCRWR